MIGLRHMKHIHAGFLQPTGKFRSVCRIHAAFAAFRRHDGKFVVNDHLRHRPFERPHQHNRKTGTVFQTATKFIGTMVHACAAQTSHQTVAMYLDHVHARLLRALRTCTYFVDDGKQRLFAHLVSKKLHIMVQPGTHLFHFPLGEKRVDRIAVVFRMKNLDAQLCSIGMHTVCKQTETFNLAVIKQLWRGRKTANGRNVAQHDVSHTALCQTGIERAALFPNAAVPFLIARGERRKHDTVLQRYSAHCYRLHDFHFHCCLPPCKCPPQEILRGYFS